MIPAHLITASRGSAGRWSRAIVLPLLLLGLAGCGDDTVKPPAGGRVWRATPTGAGSECGTAQACLDRAADGDTVELAAGIYDAVTDTLADDGSGTLVTVCLTARPGVALRAAPGADVRVDGDFDEGRIGLHKPRSVPTLAVRGLRFDNCAAGIRAVDGSVSATECRFVAGRHGLVADGVDLDLESCRFEEFAGLGLLLRDCGGSVRSAEFWETTTRSTPRSRVICCSSAAWWPSPASPE